MLPTRRLFVGALVAALLLGGAGEGPLWLFGALCYVCALGGVVLLDWLRTPPPAALDVQRRVAARLSLGADNPVEVVLRSRARVHLRLLMRDEPPPDLPSSGEQQSVLLPAGGLITLRYTVCPWRRGAATFGRVNLRYRSLLGLFQRQAAYPLATPVKIYPNLHDARAYDLAARSGLLREAGLRRTRWQGSGSEFERLREYRPDDDYRRINWPATARRGEPITADYQVERAQNVLILLDVGRLMVAPVGPLSKLDHAVNTALLLSYVCLRRGDNVGLLAFADRVVAFVAPRGGQGQFSRLLESLYSVSAHPVESDYARAFNEAALRVRRRSLVVTFTDVADPDSCRLLIAALARAAARHVPLCATLRDPVIEAYATAPIMGSPAVYERAVAHTLLEARAATLRILRARGVLTVDVAADRLSPAVIDTYLRIKAQGRL